MLKGQRPAIRPPAVRAQRARSLYTLICELPGQTLYQLEQHVGVSHGTFASLIGQLDIYGYLVFEDERGRLYPFDNIGSR